MTLFSLENPVFQIYVIAASLAILKMIGHAFLTVQRMMSANGGFLNPEDTRRTFGNPNPSPEQLAPNDYVERARRLHRNEGENTPLFLAAGLLLVTAAPPLWLAAVLLGGYVVARVAHTIAYLSQQNHEVRAACFSASALCTVVAAGYALVSAVGA